MKLEDWLDDLCVRFVVNIPVEELASIERICFQIEEAQWYYEDFVRPQDPSLPSLSLKPFFTRITQRCPLFAEWPQDELAHAFERFLKYKNRVPVRGAILLNDKMDQVLLVKGWKKSATWSFPRGKINKDEDDLDCAIREAWEETGFDLNAAGLVSNRKKVKSIEKTMRSQNLRLFVFRGVPQDAKFIPQTRKEISKVEWFKLSELPTEKRRFHTDGQVQGSGMNPNKFYVVAPFMHELKRIISAERKRDVRQTSRMVQPSHTDATDHSLAEEYEIPVSPAIPSSLPEVAATDNRQQSTIASPDADTKAKSNALLALLHKPPTQIQAASLQNLRQTDAAYDTQQPSTDKSVNHNIQAASTTELSQEQASQPAPNPVLGEHARSLLGAFNQQSQPNPTQQLPFAKQSLLAAFKVPSPQPTNSIPQPNGSGDSLLQLLQVQPQSNAKHVSQEKEDKIDSSQIPTPSTIQPNANMLLGLLQQKSPPIASTPRSYAAAASSVTQSKPILQVPAELATVAEHKLDVPKPLASPKIPKVQKGAQTRSVTGPASATLDRPFNEPRFDTIPQIPADEHIRRDPISASKKLFDPQIGQNKHSAAIKANLQREDRARVPKSPRTPRNPQYRQSRPSTPKESQKPFQPQILKRPQTSDGDPPLGLQQLTLPQLTDERISTGEKGIEILSRRPHPPAPVQDLPLPSPRLSTPSKERINSPVTLADVPSHMIARADPQKEALLSLLKTPVKTPSLVDSDATPRALPVTGKSTNDDLHETEQSRLEQTVSPVVEDPLNANTRSRVSSLASTTHSLAGKQSVQKRETAPNDKAFLLSFLKGMATES